MNLRTVMHEMVDLTRREPGTLNYEWFLSDDAANCHFYERYADSAAVLTHATTFPDDLNERFLAPADSAYGLWRGKQAITRGGQYARASIPAAARWLRPGRRR